MTYSAYVMIHNNMMGNHQHVIAQGRTERGMLGELRRYTIKRTGWVSMRFIVIVCRCTFVALIEGFTMLR